MSLIKWRNNSLFPSLTGWTDDFFNRDDDFFSNWSTGLTIPAVNVVENKAAYELEIAAPGMKKDDFKIEVNKGVLTLSAEKEESSEEKDTDYTRKEFSYSKFRRSFWLPENVITDNIEAKYEDGVLKLRVPKTVTAEPESSRLIKVG